MENIQIRFNGTADFKEVYAEAAKLNAKLMAMQKQLAASVTPDALNQERTAFNKKIADSGLLKDYSVQAVKAKTATQQFTESLIKQDVGFRQAVTSRGLFNNVLREQINLQKMLAVQWSKNASGQVTADIVMPKGVSTEVNKLTSSLRDNFQALLNNKKGTAEFAQAAEVLRVRMGLYNEIVASSADNMIKWGKNTQWAGRQLMVGFTVPFAAFAAVAGMAANKVDQELTRVVKVYNTTATEVGAKQQELDRLRTSSMANATKLAKEYGVSIEDTISLEADLAATGLQGTELLNKTNETMRAATLGELDRAAAMKTTVALQSVYKMNSQQTADAFNYMNSMENETVLSMKDFTEMIPRAAGPLNDLGVNLQNAGTLMTAMKAAGIDVGVGANALKGGLTRVLNPSKQVQASLKSMNVDIVSLVKNSGGDFFQVLVGLSSQMKDLNNLQKQQAISKLFGAYNYPKINAIISQLGDINDTTTQIGKANAIAGKSTEDWLKTADGEMTQIQNSISNKFTRAVQTLRAELASVGGPFLQVGTTIVNIVSKILHAFNSLPNGVKMFGLIVAGAMAVAGPLIMMTGLMANLIGQVLKMGTSFVMLSTKYRTMTAEQKYQALLSKQNSLLWNQEASSAQLLSSQLQQLTDRFEVLAVAQANANGANINSFTGGQVAMQGPAAPGIKQDQHGKWRHPNGNFATAVEIKAQQAADTAAASIATSAAKTEKSWTGIATSVGAVGVGAAFAAQAIAPTNDAVMKWTNIALIASTVGPALVAGLNSSWVKGALSTLGTNFMKLMTEMKVGISLAAATLDAKFGGAISKAGTAAKNTFTTVGTKIKALAPLLATLGIGVAAAGLVALGVFLKIRSEMKKSEEAQRKIGQSAKDWADILGYAKTDTGKVTDAQGKQVDSAKSLVTKLGEANKPLVDQLQLYKKLGEEQKLLDAATMEGIKVKMSGGTTAQAKQAMKTALMAAGFEETEVNVTLLPKISLNMDDANAVIDKQAEIMATQFKDAMDNKMQQSGWEGFGRWISGNGDTLNSSGKEAATQIAKQFWDTFIQKDAQGRLAYFDNFQKQVGAKQAEVWNNIAKESKDALAKAGITNMQQLQQMVSDADTMGPGSEAFNLKYTGEQLRALMKLRGEDKDAVKLSAQTEKVLAQEIARSNHASEDTIKNINTLNDLRGINLDMAKVSIADAKTNYEQTIKEASARGGLSDAEKLNALNQFRLAAGLKAATSVSQGFNAEVAKTTTVLDANGKALDTSLGTVEEWSSAWLDAQKTAMSGAQGQALSQADKLAGQHDAAQIDAINASGQRRQDALDAQGEAATKRFDARQTAMGKSFDNQQRALDKKFDTQGKALATRWDSTMNTFDKTWEKRKTVETAYYDAKIKKVNDAIQAEQDAEALRQKIFEAEKTRVERLAQIANQNIDFNMALNAGNLDEAAKVFNNIQAQQDSWAIGDAATASATGSETRQAGLTKAAQALENEKTAKLKQLDDIEAAEKAKLDAKRAREEQALADQKQRETDALTAKKERETIALQEEQARFNKSLQASKDKATADTKAQVDAHQAVLDDKKVKLEAEIATIKASTPRTKAEYDAQIKAIEAAYNRYGVRLQGYGKTWTGYIGSYLTSNIAASAAALKDGINWKQIAADITKQFVDGAFGMSLEDFSKWVTTGQMPKNFSFGKGSTVLDPASKQKIGDAQTRKNSMHTGGIVGVSGGGRTGMSGSAFRDEMPINALKGEGILNTKATRTLGADFINAANSGNIPKDIGGPDLGIAGVIGAAMAGMMSMVTAGAIMRQANTTAAAQAGSTGDLGSFTGIAGKAGKYGSTSLSGEQLGNAATIIGVGKSLGASSRDQIIAIMAAMQESTLKNLSSGDRDSVGLFQQRAPWGSFAERTNPSESSRMFFQGGHGGQPGLFDKKNRNNMSLAQAAQAVQVSAFPDAYAKWEAMARAVVSGTGITGGAGASGGFIRPVSGPITSRYGMRVNPVTGVYKLHDGTDIAAPRGTGIKASNSGTVERAGMASGYGNWTVINHGNGQKTGYAHQDRMNVHPGQSVTKGSAIGNIGMTGNTTGPHLHFMYGKGGKWVNPNLLIPGLKNGGFTLSDGYAKLHAKEAVLTAPLTEQLKSGIQKIDQGVTNGYNVHMDMRNSTFASDIDVEAAVTNALKKTESKMGVKRKIGE